MASENRLPLLIFAVLALVVATPVAFQAIREQLRPRLVEVRVVTASDDDPVFRDGPRKVPPGRRVEIAAALRIERLAHQPVWLSPTPRLAIDGHEVEHVQSDVWPDRTRSVRVFWFTVECTNVGGELTSANAAKKLQYRSFLAPEMGQGMLAASYPEAHNDDHLGPAPNTLPIEAGTLRLYTRVEVFDPDRDAQGLQAVSSLGVEHLLDVSFPAVHRAALVPEGVDPVVGELFLLPGFEPEGDSVDAREDATRAAFDMGFSELVTRRLVVSSSTFAATAAAGTPRVEADRLTSTGTITWNGDDLRREGLRLLWQRDVLPGDMVRDGDHWVVLLKDDGNGVLDSPDDVIHCWRRSPGKTTVGGALADPPLDLELIHRVR